jgi:hypothetical protein
MRGSRCITEGITSSVGVSQGKRPAPSLLIHVFVMQKSYFATRKVQLDTIMLQDIHAEDPHRRINQIGSEQLFKSTLATLVPVICKQDFPKYSLGAE